MINDTILFKKIKIWLNLPINYRIKKELSSCYATIVIEWKNDIMIICSIFIHPEFRSCGIFTNLLKNYHNL